MYGIIKTSIGKNTIVFSWKDELPCLLGNELRIKYAEDISRTPHHLANFMFGMIMLDAFIHCKKPVIFDELTPQEKTGLEKNFIMSHASRGCCGTIPASYIDDPHVNTKPPTISTLKTVETESYEHDDPVLISAGLGKDSLASMAMVDEMDLDFRFFLVGRHTMVLPWRERVKTIKRLASTEKIKTSVILTNFFELRPYIYRDYKVTNIGFYPYFYGLPLNHAYGSKVLLGATEIHNSKVHAKTFRVACAPESIFGAYTVSMATGIFFSSPTRATTEYGIQKIFSERYPELKKFQRSCDRGLPWCNTCSKCRRTALNLQAAGFSPKELGLKTYKRGELNFSKYHRHHNADMNIEKKLFGEEYSTWAEQANENVFDLIWNGKNIKKIFGEHLDFYDYDPGLDDGGYLLAPSKWREWLNSDITTR